MHLHQRHRHLRPRNLHHFRLLPNHHRCRLLRVLCLFFLPNRRHPNRHRLLPNLKQQENTRIEQVRGHYDKEYKRLRQRMQKQVGQKNVAGMGDGFGLKSILSICLTKLVS